MRSALQPDSALKTKLFAVTHLIQVRIFLLIAIPLMILIPAALRALDGLPQQAPCCGPITPAGERLAATLDGMNVESLWLAQEHVNWETGEPDRGGEDEGPGHHTHCSAFAAAASRRLNVYLLRPPEHGQKLLANAQFEWLQSPAAQQRGWQRVSDMLQAQRLANQGNLVLVAFENPNKELPGHIAVVRPSEKSLQDLQHDGPQIIQAGIHNHASTVVRIGFLDHPGAWPDGVRYFMHTLPE
jgi:hypothetical protein